MQKLVRTDYFVACLTILVAGLLVWQSSWFVAIDHKIYDLAMNLSAQTASDKVAVIAIDEQSIASLGPWPWPRTIHAHLNQRLAAAGAKVIGQTSFVSEPQIDPGMAYINRIQALHGAASKTFADAGLKQLPAEYVQIGSVLDEARLALNPDAIFAVSLAKAGNVILPMYVELGTSPALPEQPLPAYLQRTRLDPSVNGLLQAQRASFPLTSLGQAASGVGVLLQIPDAVDGILRCEPLAFRYLEQVYPSVALMLAARSLGLQPGDIRITPERGELTLEIGRAHV